MALIKYHLGYYRPLPHNVLRYCKWLLLSLMKVESYLRSGKKHLFLLIPYISCFFLLRIRRMINPCQIITDLSPWNAFRIKSWNMYCVVIYLTILRSILSLLPINMASGKVLYWNPAYLRRRRLVFIAGQENQDGRTLNWFFKRLLIQFPTRDSYLNNT